MLFYLYTSLRSPYISTMKLFLIALVVSVICVQILAEEISKEKRMEARNTCKKKSGVVDKVLDEALNGNFQEDDKLKDHSKCFFEEIGVLNGNDIDNEKLEGFVKVALPDKKDQAKQIAQECSQMKMDDPKETAFEVAKCVLEKKKE